MKQIKAVTKFLFLMQLIFNVHAQNNIENYPFDYLQEGEEAYKKKDYTKFFENTKKAQKLAPNHPSILYSLARANALVGNQDEALKWLEKAIVIGGNDALDTRNDVDFTSIKSSPQFQILLQKIDKMKTPIQNSQIGFIIPERDLMPEGTTFDPITETLFLSSLYKRKIISIDKNGGIKNFINEKQDNIGAVGGMEIDTKRRILWAAAGVGERSEGKTGVFKFDLNTGKLIKKYLLDGKSNEHSFNDLIISSKGDVYITDTNGAAVYKISHEKDELELFIKPEPTLRRFHNGITITPDDKYLFIAHGTGIDIVDLKTQKQLLLSHPAEITLAGVDGLSFYRNSLIAHQNAVTRSVNRYYLSNDLKQVLRKEIIDSHRPEFNIPSTGAIANNSTYYYIANAQFRSFTDGKIWPMDRLKDVIILKAKL